jgi:glyoxylase-like metal-dependent hydrolase (beta-lactamase superfamily II)
MNVRIADRWFDRKRVDDDITLLREPHVDPFIRCNIWHVRGRDSDLLVDTGLGIASLRDAARDLFDKPVTAVATHTHYDHSGSMHEFETRIVHRSEAELVPAYFEMARLRAKDMPEAIRRELEDAGYPVPGELLSAYPSADFDPASYRLPSFEPTRVVDEGDIVDLGDRAFAILSLPGHSPGSLGLWEERTGILFSGDAVYDGPLLDRLPLSNVADYIATMERLRSLPVTVVHAGHDPSFDRARLIELTEAYLDERGRTHASDHV